MMCNVLLTIDFGSLGSKTFVGRDRGEAVRNKFKLDDLDADNGCVEIIVPDSIDSISTSFLLGMLGDSIQKAGDKNSFRDKYIFTLPGRFEETLERCIFRALNSL